MSSKLSLNTRFVWVCAQLEHVKAQLEECVKDVDARAERLSVKTREGMQAAMDTLMKKWMDAV